MKIRYELEPEEYVLAANLAKAERPADQPDQKTDSVLGAFASAYVSATVKIDATFTTPCHIHAQMEPHATLAYWQDGSVMIHCAAQLLKSAK